MEPKLSKNWMQNAQKNILNISFQTHIIMSALLRFVLICYSQLHDAKSTVPYTDIDYKVVTDGARLVLAGDSPFKRHTYRYSPIMAYMLIPNVLLHPAFGKIIYAIFDLLVGVFIYAVVHLGVQLQYQNSVQKLAGKLAKNSACFWLYNPLTAVISTRGSGDSFTSFFVILSLYLLFKSQQQKHQATKYFVIFCAGFCHGFVIHLRLYPIVFSLAYYLCLSTRKPRDLRDFLQVCVPNKQQICLVLGTLLGLAAFTCSFFALYGRQYLYEAYFYHFVRKDVRHNFSLHFLMQYLNSAAAADESSLVTKFLVLAPQLLLLIYLSLSFGQFQQTLPFCVFCLAFVIVTYNSVVTSQYFIWYLSMLPLCLNNFPNLSLIRGASLLALWLGGQAMWLLPAYLLEFKTWDTFYWIGLQGALFFVINSYILAQLIRNYDYKVLKISFKKSL